MNFSELPTVTIPQEFLAVVLAGFGNDLIPLTSDYGDEPCPKALLPVGNRPMISYTLAWLEESGVKDVLLVCPTSHRPIISHYIHSDLASGPFASLRIDIQTYDQSQELSAGTCRIISHFAHRIHGDFIILPCDFFPAPSLHLSKVLDKFRIDSVSDGAVMTSLWFEYKPPEKAKGIEDTWPATVTPVPIIYDEKSGTLLHVDTPDDSDRNSEELEPRMGLIRKYPRTRMTASLLDANVYVCKRSVLDVLAQKPQFDSFREEFVPWLCKVHTQHTKREKYGGVLSSITNNNPASSQSLALQHSTLHQIVKRTPIGRSFRALASEGYPSTNVSRASIPTEMTPTAPPSPTYEDDEVQEEESLRCGIVVHRLCDGYAARSNNIWSYLELNRASLKDLPPTSHDPNLINPKTTITDSLIGESTKIGERSVVKRSVIGRHCVIGKNVKISGSVLLDHCIIDDDVKVDGSLLGKNTHVNAKGELVLCIAPAGYEVERGGVYKHEKLDASDWTAAPVSEESEEDDESEGDDTDDE
ncbi:UDP-3-O-glucosamine N-acyltransferase [Rickenella mellea]|uniref:Translation initiation factor eIF2B subunit gamma n=1 Tax=Rickenella mellea TaxID=50990 RepID=A0A4Y7Q473_9AGAM|nr:UDP-3-O-glucosamine N-acyltransferase [Rickenella mellea]